MSRSSSTTRTRREFMPIRPSTGRDSFSTRAHVEHRTGDVTHLSHEVHAFRAALAGTAVNGRASHNVASTPNSNPRRRCSGTLKGVFEEAQRKHRARNSNPSDHSAITNPIRLHELLRQIDRSLRGTTVAIISRFARSIHGAYRDNSIGSWDRRAQRRRSSSYHLRRSARVSSFSVRQS